MEQRVINPWRWQDQFGYSQAIEIRGAERILFCAGQVSIDAEGNIVHAGDLRAQLNQAFDNLEAVLSQAGFSLANVVRLNYFTTDPDGFGANDDVVKQRFAAAGHVPASVLIGVARLGAPDLLIEIEATAVK